MGADEIFASARFSNLVITRKMFNCLLTYCFFSILSALNTMAAIKSLMTRDSVAHLAKRQNWAAREPGVIVVFCIVGVGMSTPAFSFCDDLC